MGTHSVEHFICLLYALDYLKAKKLKLFKEVSYHTEVIRSVMANISINLLV